MSVHNLADERAKRRPEPTLIFDTEVDALTYAARELDVARDEAVTAEAAAPIDRAAAAIAACLNLHHRPVGGAR